MARLPQSLDVAAPQGQRPTTATARPTDFGLGDLAQGAEAWAQVQVERQSRQAQQQADDNALRAQEVLRPYQAQFEQTFAAAAQTDAADKPNFAAATLAHLDDHFMPVNAVQDEGLQLAMRNELSRYRTHVGDRAIQVQSTRRGQLVAAQENEKNAAQVGQLLTGYMDDYAKRKQALTDGFDGSRPGFAGDVTGAHQASAAALLESPAFQSASPQVQTLIKTRLDERMVTEHASALEVESTAHEAYLARTASDSANALVNNILSNPVAYATVGQDLDTVLASIPSAQLRSKTRQAYMETATDLRVRGLIYKGQEDVALQELEGGQYDKILSPESKTTLLHMAKAATETGPRTMEQFLRQADADTAIDAETAARRRGETTGFSLQSVVDLFTPEELAKKRAEWTLADRQFAATGNPRHQTTQALQASAMAPPPDLQDPDYALKLKAWEQAQVAAEAELKTRKDPAAWAMSSERAGDTGAQLQAKWQAFASAPDPAARGKAGANYAILSLGLQQRGGIAPSSMRVLTSQAAAGMVDSYVKATPDRRAAALQSIAETIYALPPNVRMGDGTVVSARQLALRELKGAKLGAAGMSAVVDLHDQPGALALYTDAVANPTANKKLTQPGAESNLVAQVDDQLHDYFATSSGLPGAEELNDGRRNRVQTVARHLMDIKGLGVRDAVREAAADLNESYRFVDNWRMPVDKANELLRGGQTWQWARTGAARVLDDLAVGQGLMPAPGQPGMTLQQRQQSAADQVMQRGRWITQEGDGGLMLMMPDARGYAPVLDKYGRPVRLSWDQLAQRGRDLAKPMAWMPPPPNAQAPQASPAPKAAQAFSRAIEWQESRGNPRAVSPAGALGAMQMMPATAERAAKRLGIAFDERRLLSDANYNRQLGNEEIRYLSQKYDGNIALIAAAYNAGDGAVDKWIKRYGDPRKGAVNADQFVAMIPYDETRKYVRSVLPRALTYLKG